MKQGDYVYRPRKLHMGISGQGVAQLATKQINSSLMKQNICIACYDKAQTVQQLSDMLGIPAAYIESDLAWLVEMEFMTEENGRYCTTFMIITAEQEQEEYAIYLKHRKGLSDVIVRELLAAEETIRSIGFYGCDKPMDKLLWQLIYAFCNYQKADYQYHKAEAPIRPDGGRYFPLGFDRTDIATIEKVLNTTGWAQNGSMHNDGFWWYGLYNFGKSEIEDMLDAYTAEDAYFHQLLKELIYSGKSMVSKAENASTLDISDFGLDISCYPEDKKFEFAKMVQKGFVRTEKSKVYPNFTVFTKQQYEMLKEKVFAPLAEKVASEVEALTADLESYAKHKLPAQLADYQKMLIRMALVDMDYVTTILAFEDGKLYRPETKEDGEFLTLMYIER